MGCECNALPPHEDTDITWQDIGHEHYISYLYSYKNHDLTVGVIVRHIKPDGKYCDGAARWRHYESETGVLWTLESENPLTISPSLLCHCGDHGFIKQGKWIPV